MNITDIKTNSLKFEGIDATTKAKPSTDKVDSRSSSLKKTDTIEVSAKGKMLLAADSLGESSDFNSMTNDQFKTFLSDAKDYLQSSGIDTSNISSASNLSDSEIESLKESLSKTEETDDISMRGKPPKGGGRPPKKTEDADESSSEYTLSLIESLEDEEESTTTIINEILLNVEAEDESYLSYQSYE